MSHSGVDLLQFGDKALEPVLAQLKNSDALVRAGALRTAARILESKRDKDSVARLDGILRSSLKDPRPAVRTAAIWEIGCLENKQDYIPVLGQIAKTDTFKLPGKALDGGDGDEFFR